MAPWVPLCIIAFTWNLVFSSWVLDSNNYCGSQKAIRRQEVHNSNPSFSYKFNEKKLLEDYIYLAPLLPQWTKLNWTGDLTTKSTINREPVVSPEPHLLQNKDPVPMRFVHPLNRIALHCRTVSQDKSLRCPIGLSTNLQNLQAQHSTSLQHCDVCEV